MDGLGVGTTYLPGLQPLLRDLGDLIQVVEIEPQAFWKENGTGDLPYRVDATVLERLAALPQAKLFHGVGFPVGGSRPPPFLPALHAMAQALRPAWVSEHLSFNTAADADGPFNAGFLLPPRQTAAGALTAAAAIRAAAAGFTVPFAFETGVNYLRPRADELSDGAFFAAVAAAADCDILLDLHNLHCNERNGRQAARAAIAELPSARVRELHLAGGCLRDGYWLDAHSGPSPEEVFALAAEVIPRFPNLRAIIFEILPAQLVGADMRALRRQLERMHDLWSLRRPRAAPAEPAAAIVITTAADADAPSPRAWEDALGGLVAGRPRNDALSRELAADPGTAVLIALAHEARAAAPALALTLTTRLLLLTLGEQRVRALLEEFWVGAVPELFPAREAAALARHLRARCGEPELAAIAGLRDVLAYEDGVLRAFLTRTQVRVRFAHDPAPLIAALCEGRLHAGTPAGGPVEIGIEPDGGGLTLFAVAAGLEAEEAHAASAPG